MSTVVDEIYGYKNETTSRIGFSHKRVLCISLSFQRVVNDIKGVRILFKLAVT